MAEAADCENCASFGTEFFLACRAAIYIQVLIRYGFSPGSLKFRVCRDERPTTHISAHDSGPISWLSDMYWVNTHAMGPFVQAGYTLQLAKSFNEPIIYKTTPMLSKGAAVKTKNNIQPLIVCLSSQHGRIALT